MHSFFYKEFFLKLSRKYNSVKATFRISPSSSFARKFFLFLLLSERFCFSIHFAKAILNLWVRSVILSFLFRKEHSKLAKTTARISRQITGWGLRKLEVYNTYHISKGVRHHSEKKNCFPQRQRRPKCSREGDAIFLENETKFVLFKWRGLTRCISSGDKPPHVIKYWIWWRRIHRLGFHEMYSKNLLRVHL